MRKSVLAKSTEARLCKKKSPVEKNEKGDDSLRQGERKELRINNFYYDVTDFAERHPGGRVIDFYINTGEDAVHAIQQFHYRSRSKVDLIMKSFKRRQKSSFESFDGQTERRRKILTTDFNKLYSELEAEGMFETSYTHNALRLVEVIVLGIFGYYLIPTGNTYLKLLGIFLASLAHARSNWIEHEAGHRSITGIPTLDQIFQSILFGVASGMSARVWNTRHKRHHSMPNKLDYDIDLDLLPALVSDVRMVKDPDKQFLWFAKYQVFLLPFTGVGFIASHQLYYHPKYVWKHGYYLDGISMLTHYAFIWQCGIIPFLLINFLSLFYTQVVLALSHTSLPVHATTYHWVEDTFLHTLNINQSWLNDWLMGYVNTQIEHHLFPAMPHFRHKLIGDRVKALAKKHNLPYFEYTLWKALSRTILFHYQVQKELQEMF